MQTHKLQPTPVFLLVESHGQRGLVGYSPWGHKEFVTIEKQWHEVRVEVLFLHVHLFHIIFKRYICFDISENKQTNKL